MTDYHEHERRALIQRLNKVHVPREDQSMWIIPYIGVLMLAASLIFIAMAFKSCDNRRLKPRPAATLSPAQKKELVRQYYEMDAARLFK